MVVLNRQSMAYQAARAMADNHIGAVLVAGPSGIAGILTDRDLALFGIGMVNRIFELDRSWVDVPPARRLSLRQQQSQPVFDALIAWCKKHLPSDENKCVRIKFGKVKRLSGVRMNNGRPSVKSVMDSPER